MKEEEQEPIVEDNGFVFDEIIPLVVCESDQQEVKHETKEEGSIEEPQEEGEE